MYNKTHGSGSGLESGLCVNRSSDHEHESDHYRRCVWGGGVEGGCVADKCGPLYRYRQVGTVPYRRRYRTYVRVRPLSVCIQFLLKLYLVVNYHDVALHLISLVTTFSFFLFEVR